MTSEIILAVVSTLGAVLGAGGLGKAIHSWVLNRRHKDEIHGRLEEKRLSLKASDRQLLIDLSRQVGELQGMVDSLRNQVASLETENEDLRRRVHDLHTENCKLSARLDLMRNLTQLARTNREDKTPLKVLP